MKEMMEEKNCVKADAKYLLDAIARCKEQINMMADCIGVTIASVDAPKNAVGGGAAVSQACTWRAT